VVGDGEGRIWFSLTRGLSVVDPSHITNTSAPALPHVEGLMGGQQSHYGGRASSNSLFSKANYVYVFGLEPRRAGAHSLSIFS